jgi:hypothetical protein
MRSFLDTEVNRERGREREGRSKTGLYREAQTEGLSSGGTNSAVA